MLQTDVTMPAPDIPPPTPAEARKALDAAFAEIGIVFKKKPIVIKECGNKNWMKSPIVSVKLGWSSGELSQFVTTEKKLEQHLTRPIFLDETFDDDQKSIDSRLNSSFNEG